MADLVSPDTETVTEDVSLLGGAAPEGATIEGDATVVEDKSLLGDAKPEGEAAEGEEGKPEDDKPKDEGAPEEYADFEMPEGITLDEETTASFREVAKELNLSQENAQKLVALATANAAKQQEAFEGKIVAEVEGWADATRSDPEIGKTNLPQTLAHAAAARDTFASPEFVQYLNDTRLGDHPEMVRFFAKIGKAIGEDNLVRPGKATADNVKPFFDHPSSRKA